MRRKGKGSRRWLMPVLPVMWLAGCAGVSTPSPGAVVPPLPVQARQPVTPEWCVPSCSAGLTRERERWLNWLTNPE